MRKRICSIQKISFDFYRNIDNSRRIPSFEDILNDIKNHSFLPSSKLPINYRQYLRHTNQGIYRCDQEKQCQQTTLEHSLGYFP